MPLTYDGHEQFGSLSVPRFKDEQGAVRYIEDEELATRLGAPPKQAASSFLGGPQPGLGAPQAMPDQRLASNDFASDMQQTFAGGGEQSQDYGPPVASDAPTAPKDFEGSLRETFGAAPAAPKRVDLGPADTALSGPKPAVAAAQTGPGPGELQSLGGPRTGQGMAPARSIKVADAGFVPNTEQVTTSGAAPMPGWEREDRAQFAGQTADMRAQSADAQLALNTAATWSEARSNRAQTNQLMFERTDRERELKEAERVAAIQQRHLDQDIQDAYARRVDPDRIDRRRSTEATVLSAIGLFLSGFGGVKSAESALQQIRDARDYDIQQQKDEIQEGRDAVTLRYNDYYKRLQSGRSPQVVEAELRAIKSAESVAALESKDIERAFAQNGIDHAGMLVAARKDLAKELDAAANAIQQEATSKSKYQKAQYVQVGGVPEVNEFTVLDPETGEPVGREYMSVAAANKAREEMQKTGTIISQLSRGEQLLADMDTMDKLTPTEQRARLQSAFGYITPMLSMAMGQGVVRKDDAFLEAMVSPDPTNISELKSSVMAKVRETKRAFADQARIINNNYSTAHQVNRKKGNHLQVPRVTE